MIVFLLHIITAERLSDMAQNMPEEGSLCYEMKAAMIRKKMDQWVDYDLNTVHECVEDACSAQFALWVVETYVKRYGIKDFYTTCMLLRMVLPFIYGSALYEEKKRILELILLSQHAYDVSHRDLPLHKIVHLLNLISSDLLHDDRDDDVQQHLWIVAQQLIDDFMRHCTMSNLQWTFITSRITYLPFVLNIAWVLLEQGSRLPFRVAFDMMQDNIFLPVSLYERCCNDPACDGSDREKVVDPSYNYTREPARKVIYEMICTRIAQGLDLKTEIMDYRGWDVLVEHIYDVGADLTHVEKVLFDRSLSYYVRFDRIEKMAGKIKHQPMRHRLIAAYARMKKSITLDQYLALHHLITTHEHDGAHALLALHVLPFERSDV